MTRTATNATMRYVTVPGTTYIITEADHMTRLLFTSTTPVSVSIGSCFSGQYSELVQRSSGQVSVDSLGAIVPTLSGTGKTRALNTFLFLRGQAVNLMDVTGDQATF
jgi:hypothetical protein